MTQSPGPSSTAAPGTQQYAEDSLAFKPMPTVDLSDAEPAAVSARNPGTLVVSKATSTGAAGVPTGFPHTPTGALAQMAAIDQTAMLSGTLSGVRAVIAQWSSPGGPTEQSWSGVAAMADFLSSVALSGAGSAQLAMVVTPVMGLVKGTVGPDFVVPCVDFQFDVTLNSTQHVAEADCERMVWRGERWVIGPGAEPASPPRCGQTPTPRSASDTRTCAMANPHTKDLAFSLSDLNPLHWLGSAASAAVGDVWKAAMTALWSAGLWVLGLAFKIIDSFTTPDLSTTGPLARVLPYTFAIGAFLIRESTFVGSAG